MKIPLVGVLMGSDSDLSIMKDAAMALEELGIPYEMHVMSAHRTPDEVMEYSRSASEKGIRVIIAGAGGAAHLAGVIAACTILPVIGVPISSASSNLGGLDALLSIAQMPGGVPVAAVAINGARNAGLLAAQILATSDTRLAGILSEQKIKMAESVRAKDRNLQNRG